MSRSRRAAILGVVVGVAVALAAEFAHGVAVAVRDGRPRPVAPRGPLLPAEKTTISLFEKARSSVVYITTREQVEDFWSRNVETVPKGTGSGIVWDDDGHVVTNYHVIEGATEATVRLADGSDHRASLVGVSPTHDIAVLHIDLGKSRPAPVPIGTSHDLKVGQTVLAIGNPFGLDWTLTTGVVSALNRSLTGDSGVPIEHLIQTDAAINPGNSGGPLLDSAGRLIGMNMAIYSPSGASAGIGFAVPVDAINRVVPELIRYGKYISPTLGIQTDPDINDRLSQALGVSGVFVLRTLPGSGAAAAGLAGVRVTRRGEIIPGDVILAVDGEPVASVGELVARLDEHRVGDRVRLTVLRGDKRSEVAVTLQASR